MQTNNFQVLTSDRSVDKVSDYLTILETLSKMAQSGILSLGAGHCISISDMVRNALSHRGIASRLVEVQSTITYFSKDPPEIGFIGFNNIKNPGEMDSHVVVVTETNPCFLIDASIIHRLPRGFIGVVEPITSNSKELIDSTFPNVKISMTYQQKEIQSIPYVHADSIINRIETDKVIFNRLKKLKILILVALTVVILNGVRGAWDFYQTYHIEGNNWGPDFNKKVMERLERLERLKKQR